MTLAALKQSSSRNSIGLGATAVALLLATALLVPGQLEQSGTYQDFSWLKAPSRFVEAP